MRPHLLKKKKKSHGISLSPLLHGRLISEDAIILLRSLCSFASSLVFHVTGLAIPAFEPSFCWHFLSHLYIYFLFRILVAGWPLCLICLRCSVLLSVLQPWVCFGFVLCFYVVLAGLELRGLPASASWVLGIKTRTIPHPVCFLIKWLSSNL